MRVSACADPVYVLEATDGVAPGVASPCAPGRQVHVDPCVRTHVTEGVVARPADEPISALVPGEVVVARAADEPVVALEPREPVIVAVADEGVVGMCLIRICSRSH